MGETLPEVALLPRSIVNRVLRYSESEELLPLRGESLLVATSGGADSLALLLILRDLSGRIGFELVAGHFDHKLRPTSGRDCSTVRSICERLGVRCVTGEGNVRQHAVERNLGLEEAARSMRYGFLSFSASREKAAAVATGHTLDDQAETVILRLLRGTGVRGLRGIRPKGYVPGSRTMRLVRPMLTVRHREALKVCQAVGLEPLEDDSNLDRAFTRNRVRQDVMPLLRKLNPSVDRSLAAMADSAREIASRIEQEAEGVRPVARDDFGNVFELPVFAALSVEARVEIIEREASTRGIGVDVNRTRLSNLASVLTSGGGLVRFGGIEVEASVGLVRIGGQVTPPDFPARALEVPGSIRLGDKLITVATDSDLLSRGGIEIPGEFQGVLTVRRLRAGDRMFRKGRFRKLNQVLAEERIPVWERRDLVVVSDAAGSLAAFAGSVVIGADSPSRSRLFVACVKGK